ncbi:hypothetical protein [Aestuariivirga litoralis]|uniref:hypothetical protein n=1 Tax=Aestuariivirga litoralis TaxID=2650924 RepID=UPI0018C722AD|nr:hypothetical protein [Aestuariivirga litoralis]MBG1233472.1 hypothetical protein [Aestuariivirga litoralis]
MPLQNRVDPWGELHAVAARGTMMGNRGGKFHRHDQTLGKRRWASQHWICCELHYKNAHHEAMGQGYTSLFFLDEVTALAAGHRPCFYCRRQDAKDFLGGEKVESFDRRVHVERTEPSSGLRPPSPILRTGEVECGEAFNLSPSPVAQRWEKVPKADEGSLPDGCMLEIDGEAYAVKSGQLLHWTFTGYYSPVPMQSASRLLTPPSIIAILARGYKPRWHPSAQQWDKS